jgi:hypothetical protein
VFLNKDRCDMPECKAVCQKLGVCDEVGEFLHFAVLYLSIVNALHFPKISKFSI